MHSGGTNYLTTPGLAGGCGRRPRRHSPGWFVVTVAAPTNPSCTRRPSSPSMAPMWLVGRHPERRSTLYVACGDRTGAMRCGGTHMGQEASQLLHRRRCRGRGGECRGGRRWSPIREPMARASRMLPHHATIPTVPHGAGNSSSMARGLPAGCAASSFAATPSGRLVASALSTRPDPPPMPRREHASCQVGGHFRLAPSGAYT